MDLVAANGHIDGAVFEYALVLFAQVLDHFFIRLRTEMAKLSIINVKTNCHLVAANNLVGNARIVWVEDETDIC